jgi:hypothetical protein
MIRINRVGVQVCNLGDGEKGDKDKTKTCDNQSPPSALEAAFSVMG